MTNKERIETALAGVSMNLGVDRISLQAVGPLHFIVTVKMHPWAWLACGYLHWRAYQAVKAVVDDDFSLIEVW